jgi:hypothetical protein
MTQTLAATVSGTGQEVTDEYSYSEALRLNLKTKHNDPRSGTMAGVAKPSGK